MHRVYFNKKNAEKGLVWSVDDGDQSSEVNVKDVVIRNVECVTDSGPGDNVNSPTVWLEVIDASLTIKNDVAYLKP